MDGINFLQDLAIVLLAAGLVGFLCKRLQLSVVVGYLVAGILIGPHTPPFSFILDIDRIQTLSQIGLVFLMFGIGLGLSLTKLARMGLATLLATSLGALVMLNLTHLLGEMLGWTFAQSMFMSGIFMVSSSAVIAKIVSELHLGHELFAQRAQAVTVLEDVVAVVMLTVLGTQATGIGGDGGAGVGGLLATLAAFVTLLIGAGLLLIPRMLRRLEARADPELQTIVVAGLLFLLAIGAAKAGYSLALGAFLLGAIVAEMPQRTGVEKSFAGMRDLFSSVFFVSIGMMIDLHLLVEAWLPALGLTAFVMIARPLATSFALILCGAPPRQARQAGLLLAPLGEFSFIIAQMGVAAAILPPSYYPLAVSVSILTLLLSPVVNRHSPGLLDWVERVEPRWMQRALDAYHGWFRQVQTRSSGAVAWNLIRNRLFHIAIEMMFTTGILMFSPQLLDLLQLATLPRGLDGPVQVYVFWGAIALLVLLLLVAIWRNLAAIAMIATESLEGDKHLRAPMVNNSIKTAGAFLLGLWLVAILPLDALPMWGWVLIVSAAALVVAVFSRRLIYLHSSLQSSMSEVLSEKGQLPEIARERARANMGAGLEAWDLVLDECVVPDAATCAGQPLSLLAIPSRFGCALMELERNGHVITTIRPDLRLYPGDKLLLLGRSSEIAAACEFLGTRDPAGKAADDFSGSVLETFTVPASLAGGLSLSELPIARQTGVRVAAIKRPGRQILNPTGTDQLYPGDELLVVGSLVELRAFRRWLRDLSSPPASAQA